MLYSVPSCGGLHGYPGEWKAEWRKAPPCVLTSILEPWPQPSLSLPAQNPTDWHPQVLHNQDFCNHLVPCHTLIPLWERKHLLGNHPILIWISKHESSNNRTRCKMWTRCKMFWFYQNVYNLLYYRSTKIDHLKFLELTKSTFFGKKNIPLKFLNTVVLDTVQVHTEKNICARRGFIKHISIIFLPTVWELPPEVPLLSPSN